MIDNTLKKSILNKILKSKTFYNAEKYSDLLTYLVKSTIANKIPKEYTLAIDVFNRGNDFNPSEDTLVRYYMLQLRRKISAYYEDEGKDEKIRLVIPKGHYEVKFINYSKEIFREKIKNPYLSLFPVIFVLLIIIAYLITKLPSEGEFNKNVITSSFANNLYSDFTNSDNPKIISLGDDFIYYTDFSEFRTTPIRKMYRNSLINSEEEFEKFKSDDLERESFKKLPFSFFNQAAVGPLPYLVKVLHDYDVNYLIKSASALNLNDIKTNDIIFLGSFWTLGILDHVIKELGISYNIIGDEVLSIIEERDKDSTITYERTGVPAFDHIDYCTFIKIPGPNNNTIYLVASFYATGSVGAIKYLTQEKTLNELMFRLEQEFENIPDYFLIVFKSSGFNRDVLSTELIQVKQINPEIITW